ncbi:MAG: hypothetical protein JWQ77_3480 [Jatrophihabitans sp.]|nr:hypothetical protein [Jatrophihabitans sp.]
MSRAPAALLDGWLALARQNRQRALAEWARSISRHEIG